MNLLRLRSLRRVSLRLGELFHESWSSFELPLALAIAEKLQVGLDISVAFTVANPPDGAVREDDVSYAKRLPDLAVDRVRLCGMGGVAGDVGAAGRGRRRGRGGRGRGGVGGAGWRGRRRGRRRERGRRGRGRRGRGRRRERDPRGRGRRGRGRRRSVPGVEGAGVGGAGVGRAGVGGAGVGEAGGAWPATPGERAGAFRLAALDLGLDVDVADLSPIGPVELLHWAREQTVSATLHRHGNVTGRRDQLLR